MTLSTAIEEFLEHLVIEKNRSPKTIVAYRHYLTRFLSWLKKDQDVESITADQVRKFRVYLNTLTDDMGEPLQLQTQTYHVIAL
ncbi:MAG: xerD, partial [Patescibacteria group bacterium]|nr:xerD [Patescibacteria group bacterium]